MKHLKVLVALIAGLFAFTSVQAGEVSLSGSVTTKTKSMMLQVTH